MDHAIACVTGALNGQNGQNKTYSLAEDGVTVAGDDLARLEGGPDVLGDLLVRGALADLRAHLLQPAENLLVGETNILAISWHSNRQRSETER